MRISRIHTAQHLSHGQLVTLEPGASRYLARVLRLAVGDEFVLFNGDGHDYMARIEALAQDSARIRVGSPSAPELPPMLRITLALGISKGERMDLALQKAVELGVSELQPLFTERSMVRLRDQRLRKRMQHWHGIVVSACEQSGRRWLPLLSEPLRFSDWLEQAPTRGLLLDHRSDRPLTTLPAPLDNSLTLLVGPEGGLAPSERNAAVQHGLIGVCLGPRVMRAETAPLAAIAAVQTLWGDFRQSH
ncbi:MAG TPA: 16S rRNA (uracil(1498)-N(3))-methyltransferase [Chromatiaceae bacterium]|jgi:16S rRNA (uracil1498-N3)-methyltransferase|nr:MAG: 16S rRNA (uracil(1498)-N(3))-methyltransferase [Thiohalocapsa sp. PB-PSB1]HBG93754.1 16S rRNA (uracil(1498)-N(3))-methyltransferase [Chromatiaceae bacterium]HCS91648.1 16S rRNA (uracil(1498)-N(3))-methyltransferase [Chromatiaceae bacterium]